MTEADCWTIANLSQSWLYNSLISFKLLIAASGVLYLLKQWKAHGARFLGHANSRILFHCYYAMIVTHGSCIIAVYVMELTRLRFACALLDFRIVILLRGTVLISILSSHIFFIIMSLERLYSSLYPEKFEKSAAHRGLTAAVALTVIASVTFFIVWIATNGFQIWAVLVPIASVKFPGNADKYDLIPYSIFGSNIISLIVFFIDIYLNFYRKIPTNQTLGVSYQFAENRRLISVLLPIEVIDSICSISTSLAQVMYSKFAKGAMPLDRQIFLESTTFTHVYPLILAIIIKWRVGRRRGVVHPTANAMDHHFKNLNELWGEVYSLFHEIQRGMRRAMGPPSKQMSEADCFTIASLSQSWLYNSLISFKLFIAASGVSFLVQQWKAHGARFLGHIDSRILFHCYYAMFVVHGTGISAMYVVDLTRLRFVCAQLDFRVVLSLRGLVQISLLSSHIFFIIMSLERLYSSFYPEQFEKSPGHRLLTAVVALTVVTSAAFFIMWIVTNGFKIWAVLVPIASTKVLGNIDKYDYIHYAIVGSNFLSMIFFVIDIYLNFYRKITKSQSLGVSYQFAENRRLISVLVPIEVIDSICSLSTSLAQLVYGKFASDEAPMNRQIFLEATTFTHVYPLILAIIIKWRVGRRRGVVHPTTDAIDHHFKNLNELWG